MNESFPTEKLVDIFKTLQPNVKGVLSLLKFSEGISNNDRNVMHYLRQYIKEMDNDRLKLFLRFCTGSYLLVPDVNRITVEINSIDGLARRPVAHTCGQILELSNAYENLPVFRSEFNHILSSDIWVMDIV